MIENISLAFRQTLAFAQRVVRWIAMKQKWPITSAVQLFEKETCRLCDGDLALIRPTWLSVVEKQSMISNKPRLLSCLPDAECKSCDNEPTYIMLFFTWTQFVQWCEISLDTLFLLHPMLNSDGLPVFQMFWECGRVHVQGPTALDRFTFSC